MNTKLSISAWKAFNTWWGALTLVGDPSRRPKLTEEAFAAGYEAGRAQARAELIAEMRAKPVYWYDPDTPLAIVPEK